MKRFSKAGGVRAAESIPPRTRGAPMSVVRSGGVTGDFAANNARWQPQHSFRIQKDGVPAIGPIPPGASGGRSWSLMDIACACTRVIDPFGNSALESYGVTSARRARILYSGLFTILNPEP